MLEKMQWNGTSNENKIRALKIFSGIIVILLLVGVSAAFLNNVVATPISPREMEILQFVTNGLSNKEIAVRLGISQQTVKNHMTSILKKLNVEDRTQAAVNAIRRGWVRIQDNNS